MSDIQRYEAYISGVCESGCGESMNDNGEYVKYDDINRIKAEGIRERFHAIKALMDGKGNDPFREGYLYALELFIEYADELESDNEVLEKGND